MDTVSREEFDSQISKISFELNHLRMSNKALSRAIDANFNELSSQIKKVSEQIDFVVKLLEGRKVDL